jgi:hypothetical protein
MAVWAILRQFGILYTPCGFFLVIWYIFPFGYVVPTSGNPETAHINCSSARATEPTLQNNYKCNSLASAITL